MVFQECVIEMTDEGKYRVNMIHYHYLGGILPWGEYTKYTEEFNDLDEAKYWVIQHRTNNRFTISDDVQKKLSYVDALRLDGKTNTGKIHYPKRKRSKKTY